MTLGKLKKKLPKISTKAGLKKLARRSGFGLKDADVKKIKEAVSRNGFDIKDVEISNRNGKAIVRKNGYV
jgi:hypothetical protein